MRGEWGFIAQSAKCKIENAKCKMVDISPNIITFSFDFKFCILPFALCILIYLPDKSKFERCGLRVIEEIGTSKAPSPTSLC